MPEFIKITHPDIDGEATVHPDAFEHTYKAKGWTAVEDKPARPRRKGKSATGTRRSDTVTATEPSEPEGNSNG